MRGAIISMYRLNTAFGILRYCVYSWPFFDLSSVFHYSFFHNQKQPPEVFYEKKVFLEFHKIHRKTPVPESLF